MKRRSFVLYAGTGSAMLLTRRGLCATRAVPGGSLNPAAIQKFEMPLIIPPAMPRTSTSPALDYYEIAVRQFQQQILPRPWPATTIWSYGSANHAGSFNYPSFTIEAQWNKPLRVKWLNQLMNANRNYLPHILPVDQTLHWANPPGGTGGRDRRPAFASTPGPYRGPVPIVTHVHGAHTTQESDGFGEAWYLPNAIDIPAAYATTGTYYDIFKTSSLLGSGWSPGSAVFEYPNDQRAATLWYHDHTLGMTRLNVYAGPAGFYLIRGGPDDSVQGVLPGPAPALGDGPGIRYREIPLAIQDRSFNVDGSLFYPGDRAFFEGMQPQQLQIPFAPEPACGGPSDISPIWNPEFFGNTMVVNGRAWPYLEVENRRYRFRLLNGCNSRFLVLQLSNGMPFWQIGAEGGFLPRAERLYRLLISPAERADVIVDFTNVPAGTTVTLQNLGPDEPFGGGIPDIDFPAADPQSTGLVMQFRVVASTGPDLSTPADQLVLPPRAPLGTPQLTRRLSLNEEDSATVTVRGTPGRIKLDCAGEPFGPQAALLGIVAAGDQPIPLEWKDPITENPALNATEVWEIHNHTEDAHPIHVHQVMFEVLGRRSMEGGPERPPEPWERGAKDTVIAFPDEITRIKARFDIAGLFVWHCHIVEHEDNEMMRPYRVG
ncbi:MAG TPA: multicopper oxidase [Verrucomicrobiae bacterium]|nr:multicopper oxidase [Verrucomicrobiae bacterium]